jgi:Tol biopolymer transport system component
MMKGLFLLICAGLISTAVFSCGGDVVDETTSTTPSEIVQTTPITPEPTTQETSSPPTTELATLEPTQAQYRGKIVFTSNMSGNYEIYVMNADGSNKTQLTNNMVLDYHPVLSPDGKKIAFASQMDNNAVFFNEGIGLDSDMTKGNEIYVMNADGSNQTRLTNNNYYDTVSSWSPDSSKILFISDRDGNYEIYVMNADGSNQTRLTDNTAWDGEPDWSPDGNKVVFSSKRNRNYEIYIMNPDGSNQTRLTNTDFTDFSPVWSPDGTKIAFFSNRDGNHGEVYMMNADGSNQTRLTNVKSINDFENPVWSPDGMKIAFVSDYDIWIIDYNGLNQINLTNNVAHDLYPSWSFDGKNIIFRSDRDGHYEIYIMDANGSNQTRLTNKANNWDPVWLP